MTDILKKRFVFDKFSILKRIQNLINNNVHGTLYMD